MLDPRFFGPKPTIKDGNSEIIFSDVFCLSEKKLCIEGIANFTLEFEFLSDEKRGAGEFLAVSEGEKKLRIKMFNFSNFLGNATKEPVPLINIDDKSLGKGAVCMTFRVRTMKGIDSLIEFGLTLTFVKK